LGLSNNKVFWTSFSAFGVNGHPHFSSTKKKILCAQMSLLCGWKLIFFGGEKNWSPKRGGTKEMVLSVESKARKH
jgi:hypothetical protein